jgi:hypothetical protein
MDNKRTIVLYKLGTYSPDGRCTRLCREKWVIFGNRQILSSQIWEYSLNYADLSDIVADLSQNGRLGIVSPSFLDYTIGAGGYAQSQTQT